MTRTTDQLSDFEIEAESQRLLVENATTEAVTLTRKGVIGR
jgi:hypothetical protein